MHLEILNNSIDLWKSHLPHKTGDINKHDCGHLIILGGVNMSGSARLASEAAMRMGCGLCTIVSDKTTKNIFLSGAPHIMFEAYSRIEKFSNHFEDSRRRACVMGCGAGRENPEKLKRAVLDVLDLGIAVVLDADALSVFEDERDVLFSALHEKCILTPHEGEFKRLFPDLDDEKESRAARAAEQCGAIILLKGADTVISSPDNTVIINNHATPSLATAGTGDVLAGMIGGLLAQNMDPLMACAAATWIHGDVAIDFGPGLTAPDLIASIPAALRRAMHSKQLN